MKHPLSFLGGFLAGLAAMYYLDETNGARRRAAVREKMAATGQDMAGRAQEQARRAADHVKDLVQRRGAQAAPAADAATPTDGSPGGAAGPSPGGTAWH